MTRKIVPVHVATEVNCAPGVNIVTVREYYETHPWALAASIALSVASSLIGFVLGSLLGSVLGLLLGLTTCIVVVRSKVREVRTMPGGLP